jgi:hypothetical protein
MRVWAPPLGILQVSRFPGLPIMTRSDYCFCGSYLFIIGVRIGRCAVADEPKSPSWWQTLPAVIAGLATLITALAGLVAALNQFGFFRRSQPVPSPQTMASPSHLPLVSPSPEVPSTSPRTEQTPRVARSPVAERGPWLFADSNARYLAPADLAGLSADDLWRARNEIFARRGLVFSTAPGRALAASLGSSYRGTEPDQDRVFNQMNGYERANVGLIKAFEGRVK